MDSLVFPYKIIIIVDFEYLTEKLQVFLPGEKKE